MVKEERECTEIITQIAAARAALDSAAQIVVKDYAISCVNEFSSEKGTEKMEKLMRLLFKYL